MSDISDTRRRQFLKGSLVLGAAASVAPPVLAQANASAKTKSSQLPGPNATAAHAEVGPLGAEPDPARGAEHNHAGASTIDYPGSDFMVDCLKAASIPYVAAMCGSSFRGLHESIVNHGGDKAPELIVCVHEEISAAVAHGYAKAAGKPMAIMVHSTVGLQHASMAIYNAWCDRVPVLILAANTVDETKRRPGVEWMHTAQDLGAFVRDFTKWDDTPASLEHFADSMVRAMQMALTPPYEPVLLVVDSELQEEEAKGRSPRLPRFVPISPAAGEPSAVAQAADMLIAAGQPLIAVDRAVRSQKGVDLLVRLAELLQAPVVDLGARMNMPSNHYLNHSGRQQQLVRSADVILGIELTDIWGLVNNVPDKIERKAVRLADANAKVIGVNAGYNFAHANVQDAQRAFACDLTLAADGETVLGQLVDAVGARLTTTRRREFAKRRGALEATFKDMRSTDANAAAVGWDASPISTARMSMEVWQRIKDLPWALVSQSNIISAWPQRLWDITRYHQYNGGQGGYGLGYGLPAAMGAAIAHRDAGRIPVAMLGDGDVMMLPGTFWSLAHHQIPMLMLIHNNRAWHQETMHLKRMSSRRNRGPESWDVGTTILQPNIDFASMARSMGVWAEGPIDDPAVLGPAIDRALAIVKSGKPALLDVLTQPR